MRQLGQRSLPFLALCLVTIFVAPARGDEEQAWRALGKGGAVAIIRHARAPGVGDPPTFRLEDCTTQRNLSTEGREQATRLGARLTTRGVQITRVLSSQWCRALETARLAFGDRVEPEPALNSLYGARELQQSQTEIVRRLVAAWKGREGTLVLVTHQLNATALTGLSLGEGELLVLAPKEAGFDVVGRLAR